MMDFPRTQTGDVDEILAKIEGIPMPHVPEEVRREAVERAIRMIHISVSLSASRLAEIIDTNEGQITVHCSPDDVTD